MTPKIVKYLPISQNLKANKQNIPSNLGLSLSSLRTATYTSTLEPFLIAPGGMVKVMPKKKERQLKL